MSVVDLMSAFNHCMKDTATTLGHIGCDSTQYLEGMSGRLSIACHVTGYDDMAATCRAEFGMMQACYATCSTAFLRSVAGLLFGMCHG